MFKICAKNVSIFAKQMEYMFFFIFSVSDLSSSCDKLRSARAAGVTILVFQFKKFFFHGMFLSPSAPIQRFDDYDM
jgi:hypothetical protein